ncbi:MAG: hypothetical protein HQL15_11100 [Candidatus Omnitrophica bacterium]|nr:hypothetical protein [Candidatus Omnitrophota bacterium]
MKSLFMLLFIMCCISTVPAAADSSFTQSDRDRLIKVETKLEDGLKATNQRIDDMKADINKRFEQIDKRFEQVDKRFEQVDKRFEQVDKRFDQILAIMLGGFGVLFSGMGILIGFVLWDRRTALAPAIRKTKEIEERAELLEKAVKEAAVDNPGLREALKHFGLL